LSILKYVFQENPKYITHEFWENYGNKINMRLILLITGD